MVAKRKGLFHVNLEMRSTEEDVLHLDFMVYLTLAMYSTYEMTFLCSQRGAYQKNSVAMRGIVITENRRSVRIAVIRVLLRKRTIRKEVTKVFVIQRSISSRGISSLVTLKFLPLLRRND